jgi:hypothetical protein
MNGMIIGSGVGVLSIPRNDFNSFARNVYMDMNPSNILDYGDVSRVFDTRGFHQKIVRKNVIRLVIFNGGREHGITISIAGTLSSNRG